MLPIIGSPGHLYYPMIRNSIRPHHGQEKKKSRLPQLNWLAEKKLSWQRESRWRDDEIVVSCLALDDSCPLSHRPSSPPTSPKQPISANSDSDEWNWVI